MARDPRVCSPGVFVNPEISFVGSVNIKLLVFLKDILNDVTWADHGVLETYFRGHAVNHFVVPLLHTNDIMFMHVGSDMSHEVLMLQSL